MNLEGRAGASRRRSPAGSVRGVVSVLVVVVVLAAAWTTAFVRGDLHGWFGGDQRPSVPTDVAPPTEVRLPVPRVAQPVLGQPSGPPLRPAAVRRVLSPLLKDSALGGHVGIEVRDLTHARTVLRLGHGSFTPASTLKLFTTTAALKVLGPDHRFTTSTILLRRARVPKLVLVGGGDPLLALRKAKPSVDTYPQPATLAALAARTARALRAVGTTRVRLGYDASRFTGPSASPTWPPSYIGSFVVSPVSALWVDEGVLPSGYRRAADPPLAATEAFAQLLRAHGIHIQGVPAATSVAAARTPGAATGPLAQVQSAPLAAIVQHTLEQSDNDAAEVLLRQLAIGTGRRASFAGGVAALRQVLVGLGVPWRGLRVYDGSGLSRHDRVTTSAVSTVLRLASTGPAAIRTVATGLPVAGFDGSLESRFFAPGTRAALGVVRAKTGTLTGVSGLAGLVVDRSGTPLSFVALLDRVPVSSTLAARTGLDRIAAALAGCGCP